MPRPGFTRLEVLLALGTTALVSAVLLPALAQEKSTFTDEDLQRHRQCMENLKAISAGFMLYHQDYDEWWPPAASSSDRGHGWAEILYPTYVRQRQLFDCPADKHPQGEDSKQPGYTDYWYNRNFAGQRLPFLDERHQPGELVSQTILLGDGDGGSPASNARYALNSLPKAWKDFPRSPARRHNDGANYAFPDGHVKWLRLWEITSTLPSNPAKNYYGFVLPPKKR